MNITIRYTQPKFSEHHVPKTVDHVIECSDVDTFANGHPVPIGDSAKWASTVEHIETLAMYEILD